MKRRRHRDRRPCAEDRDDSGGTSPTDGFKVQMIHQGEGPDTSGTEEENREVDTPPSPEDGTVNDESKGKR